MAHTEASGPEARLTRCEYLWDCDPCSDRLCQDGDGKISAEELGQAAFEGKLGFGGYGGRLDKVRSLPLALPAL